MFCACGAAVLCGGFCAAAGVATAARASALCPSEVPPAPAIAPSRTSDADGASASALAGIGVAAGSASHCNCVAVENGAARATTRQLSIAPVGHGGTQARQASQTAASTT